MIAYFAPDLAWAVRIKATAESLGILARPARNVEMLQALLKDPDLRALIVDLDTPEVALALIRAARSSEASPRPCTEARPRRSDAERPEHHSEGQEADRAKPSTLRVLAYGPHVARDALESARAAGADAVLPRGAFHANLVDLLKKLDAGSPSGH